MAPPKNDSSEEDWSKYRMYIVDTMDSLVIEVRKQHDDILLIKAKIFMVSALVGGGMGIIGTIIGGIAVAYLSKSLHL